MAFLPITSETFITNELILDENEMTISRAQGNVGGQRGSFTYLFSLDSDFSLSFVLPDVFNAGLIHFNFSDYETQQESYSIIAWGDAGWLDVGHYALGLYADRATGLGNLEGETITISYKAGTKEINAVVGEGDVTFAIPPEYIPFLDLDLQQLTIELNIGGGSGLRYNVESISVEGYDGEDTDGDNVPDIYDDFPNDPEEYRDADGDGVGSNTDYDDEDPDVQLPPWSVKDVASNRLASLVYSGQIDTEGSSGRPIESGHEFRLSWNDDEEEYALGNIFLIKNQKAYYTIRYIQGNLSLVGANVELTFTQVVQ